MNFLGIYIHIPYCLHKCGYCDFNSHVSREEEMPDYVSALLKEMEVASQKLKPDSEIQTIFLGGGTPTTLPTELLEKILTQTKQLFPLAPDCEITFEANPASATLEQLQCLRHIGYNRISIGVQSFQTNELVTLDRIHSPDEATTAINWAKQAGFDNLSIDLMFALTDQSPASWDDTLRQALELSPNHISTYNLMIEPGTAFFGLQKRGKLILPEDEQQLRYFQESIRQLTQAGYQHYEISNFAKPGMECRHNKIYWNNGNTFGFGAGAARYLNGRRSKNVDLPSEYIRQIMHNGDATESSERLQLGEAMGETLMLGLRMLEGVNIPQFEERFKISFRSHYEKTLKKLTQENLIHLTNERLALTMSGLYLADSVILEFMN